MGAHYHIILNCFCALGSLEYNIILCYNDFGIFCTLKVATVVLMRAIYTTIKVVTIITCAADTNTIQMT